MKVGVIPMRLEALLYYAAKFIGLAPFRLKRGKFYPATLWSKAYAIVVVVLLTMWIPYVPYGASQRLTTLHQIIIVSWKSIIATTVISAVITFTIKSETIISLMNKINLMNEKLRDLLVTDGWCHIEMGNNWIPKIIKSNGVVLLLQIIQQILIHFDPTIVEWNPVMTIGYVLNTFYVHNIILSFVQILLRVKKYFECLNKNLQHLIIGSNLDASITFHDLPNRRIFMVARGPGNSNQEMRDAINEPVKIQSNVELIKKIEIVHNEITHLVAVTTQLFTIPIVFIMYQYFFKLILLFYKFWTQVLLSPDGFNNPNVFLAVIVRLMSQLIIVIYGMVLVANACESTCRAGNITRSALDTIWNKFRPVQLQDEVSYGLTGLSWPMFVMFSFQVIHKPLAILIFGFFDLGYPYLFQMSTAVISYALVIVQIEPTLQS